MTDTGARPRVAARGRPAAIIRRIVIAGLLLAGSAEPMRAAADRGAEVYAANCSMCHQPGGVGAPGSYPPLRNRVGKIAATEAGRRYLADLLLYGMFGRIEAAGASYFGYMPSFKQLKDNDIAAVLTWLSAQTDSRRGVAGRPAPTIGAADIAAARARQVPFSDVARQRSGLALKHLIP